MLFVFIGNQEIEDYLISELQWSRKKMNILSKSINSDLSTIDFNMIEGIFTNRFDQMDNDMFDKLLKLKKRVPITSTAWCSSNSHRQKTGRLP